MIKEGTATHDPTSGASWAALAAAGVGIGAFAAVLQFGWGHVVAPATAIVAVAALVDRENNPDGAMWGLRDRALILFTAKSYAILICLALLYAAILVVAPVDWPFFPDEVGYVEQTERVAALWRAGEYPRLEGMYHLGTLHTGYQRLGAFLANAGSQLTGGQMKGGQGANTALLAVNLSLLLYIPALLAFLAGRQPNPRAFGWLLLAAAHPLHAFWAIFCMREVPLLAALLTLLILGSRLVPLLRRDERDYSAYILVFLLGFAMAASLFWLFTLRSYWAAIGIAALAWWGLFNVCRIRLMSWLPACAFGGLILVFVPGISHTLRQMADTLASLASAYPAEPTGALLQAAQAVPRLLWAPYPWAIVPEFRLFYLIFPALWLQALLIWPAALPRWWRSLRSPGTEGLISIVIALSGLSILVAFAGDAPRHTYPLMILATLLPAMLPAQNEPTKKQKIWFATYYGALILFIVLQTALWFVSNS